jgi:uncharacterized protein
MFRSRITALILLCLCLPATVRAAEVIPPVPRHYFNDYANVVPPADADQFNQQLDQFERDTSNQIVVAIYPTMQSDSDIADYTYRVKETWHVGQKDKNNGAVLFVFIQDHKLFIQTNYGLEGALPDATCKEIIDQEITPKFKTGDYTGGLRAGINAMIAATKGEYKGNGSTVNDNSNNGSGNVSAGGVIVFVVVTIFVAIILLSFLSKMIRGFGGTFYQRHASSLSLAQVIWSLVWNIGFNILLNSGSSRRGGGSWGGGGGFGGGGGGFSGGGGTGGGGGAGGSW